MPWQYTTPLSNVSKAFSSCLVILSRLCLESKAWYHKKTVVPRAVPCSDEALTMYIARNKISSTLTTNYGAFYSLWLVHSQCMASVFAYNTHRALNPRSHLTIFSMYLLFINSQILSQTIKDLFGEAKLPCADSQTVRYIYF